MIQMLKREFYLNRIYFLVVFLTFPLIHGVVYPLLVFLSILGFAIYNSFHCDYKNHTNRSFVSMPIKKDHIVLARYLFLTFSIILAVLYLWFVDNFAQYGWPPLDSGKLTGPTIFLISILFSIVVSVLIPIFYFFQSFSKAFIIQLLLILISVGIFLILANNSVFINSTVIQSTFDFIAIQPFLIPIVFSILCLYVSYRFSVLIFSSKDIL